MNVKVEAWHVIFFLSSFLPTAGSGTNVLDGIEILHGTHCKDHTTLSFIRVSITADIESGSLEASIFLFLLFFVVKKHHRAS